jgi:hypothetical protein
MAAEHVAGPDAVEEVEVTPGEDAYDRPVYYFSFLIHQERAQQRAGLVRIRLIQKLREDLVARGDSHNPVIQILSKDDWPNRADAAFF